MMIMYLTPLSLSQSQIYTTKTVLVAFVAVEGISNTNIGVVQISLIASTFSDCGDNRHNSAITSSGLLPDLA